MLPFVYKMEFYEKLFEENVDEIAFLHDCESEVCGIR